MTVPKIKQIVFKYFFLFLLKKKNWKINYFKNDLNKILLKVFLLCFCLPLSINENYKKKFQ